MRRSGRGETVGRVHQFGVAVDLGAGKAGGERLVRDRPRCGSPGRPRHAPAASTCRDNRAHRRPGWFPRLVSGKAITTEGRSGWCRCHRPIVAGRRPDHCGRPSLQSRGRSNPHLLTLPGDCTRLCALAMRSGLLRFDSRASIRSCNNDRGAWSMRTLAIGYGGGCMALCWERRRGGSEDWRCLGSDDTRSALLPPDPEHRDRQADLQRADHAGCRPEGDSRSCGELAHDRCRRIGSSSCGRA